MAVPESIVRAYEVYIEGMEKASSAKKAVSGLLGLGRDTATERCQEEFISGLGAAVDEFALSGPAEWEAAEAVRYMLSRAHEYDRGGAAYWMLMASHTLTLPLIELLGPHSAAQLRGYFESEYPSRERLPAQKKVLAALKARERA